MLLIRYEVVDDGDVVTVIGFVDSSAFPSVIYSPLVRFEISRDVESSFDVLLFVRRCVWSEGYILCLMVWIVVGRCGMENIEIYTFGLS